MKYSDIEKYAIIFVLSEIMRADGIVDEREIDFMNEMYEVLGISVNELQNITDLNIVTAQSVLKSMSDDKKSAAIEYFIRMSACDGFVDERETDVIKLFQ